MSKNAKPTFISPIAIDLGAKNTGVYFAHYRAGSSLDGIDKEGKVYQLEKDKYTLLMANRTAARHQRRGYDRRQMAKRLFKLIWCKHFGLKWDKDVQQSISFLLNRRGFSFLTEEYDADILSQFPKEAFDELPGKLKNELKTHRNDHGDYDFASALTEWANKEAEKIEQMYEVNQEPSRIRKRLVFISMTKKLHEYCSKRKAGDKVPEERKRPTLSRLSNWILKEWVKDGTQGLPANPSGKTIDMVKYLNEQEPETAENILRSLPKLDQEKKELKESVWDFSPGKFNMEKADFGYTEVPNVKTHLHHFAFAIHKIHSELESGGRHRRKYFAEVKNILEQNSDNHSHVYLREFCKKLQSGGFKNENIGLKVDSLFNLIGHISNLEIKPLRKYFNDKRHKQGDFWDESRLAELFRRWVLREWRVGEKDKDKADGKEYSYSKLKTLWDSCSGSVMDFWLNTPPGYTIPPYQNNNNRRPPKCQSLIFNVRFLDQKYKDWRKWLGELKKLEIIQDYLGDYESQLKRLESGKKKPYFSTTQTGEMLIDSGRRSTEELDARTLQFIFDRVKDEDPLNLNQIYSHAKKIKQDQHKTNEATVKSVKEVKEKLEEAIKESKLQKDLKSNPNYSTEDLFSEGGFFHLVCKYYKLRQRAKDERIYIHPQYRYVQGRGYENTGRFDDRDHLLTYCNHKPRQKRYQMLGDLASLLQISPQELEQFAIQRERKTIDDEDKVFNWLEGIGGLRANCDRAAREQKDRRGSLKSHIQRVFALISHKKQSESPSKKEIRKILKSSKVDKAQGLYDFCERAKELCLLITESLYSDSRQQKWKKELGRNPAVAVYMLAQVNNIAFKERSGNANTCAVCSMDNAQRMQQVQSGYKNEGITAKAQRLPAISTRIIDGAIMRMARIVGGAIAKDKWPKIKAELEADCKVCIPIITESNRFEFEPSKEDLVKNQRIAARKGKVVERGGEDRIFQDKGSRIKESGQGICPYTGDDLSEEGESDHIIPRSSKWGTLNDEANLIYASNVGNKNKGEEEYSLNNLNARYKNALFGTTDGEEIQKKIIESIWDEKDGDGCYTFSGDKFKFGTYRSFINLAVDEQRAFRHALFLKGPPFLKGQPLREKVIAAIDNKNRAFVNGTQRYFAEVLANKLYKLAKAERKEKLLSFDYFGVEAKPNSAGNSIYDLRKMYEAVDDKIAVYAKSKDTKQQAYSHLLDAQMAFVIIADAHRKEGGLKLQIEDTARKEPYNENTGEVRDGLLKCIQIQDDNFELKSLVRRKVYEVETHHREMLNKGQEKAIQISYKIHRDNLIAEKFMPLIHLENGEFKKGFSIENSVAYKSSDFEKIKAFLYFCESNKDVWLVRKKEALNHLVNAGRNVLSKEEQKIAELLDGLSYQTVKKKIGSVLSHNNKEPQIVSEALQNWDECIIETDFKKDGVLLPVFHEWKKLKTELEKANPEQSLQVCLQNSEMFRDKQNSSIKNHNKKRKVYSLPVIAGIGTIRLNRRAWDGQNIIQTAAVEGLAQYGLSSQERPHTILSKNSIPVKHYSGIPEKLDPDPIKWKEIPDEYIDKYNVGKDTAIFSGKIKFQDAGRCKVSLLVKDIRKMSLPQEEKNWKGKLFRHEDKKIYEEKKANEKGPNHHYLKSAWKWFSKPFELPEGRNEVIVRNIDGIYEIKFTISKVKEVERWL